MNSLKMRNFQEKIEIIALLYNRTVQQKICIAGQLSYQKAYFFNLYGLKSLSYGKLHIIFTYQAFLIRFKLVDI